MKFDNSTPIYLQVVAEIKKEIVVGKIMPGDKLPSGRDLAVKYVINPNTSARVYQVLESEGICHTRRGMGTYVNEDENLIQEIKSNMAEEYLTAFLKNMHALGYEDQEIAALITKEGK